MHNATRDAIYTKASQLEAMLNVISIANEYACDEIDATVRSNFSWVMVELVEGIKAALDADVEVDAGCNAECRRIRSAELSLRGAV
ncbi:hypothetical protein WJ47_27835 [Burkholderia ubonensis]|uniref:Uncharacterized protein n=1 Tax=Burkholderia ubonensis TaxID=101571 RepID=A0AB73G0P6_9BURK|nr:hypothetical protein [Burkholderia ubonensis]KVK85233.1 hypothetical protein WJ44_03735 [Burkholderia ubonensis]KVL79328.1 hypothetical protein WJ47_27835 [Burkholderia ubonensis]KVM32792.1 hypothetical protein WJ53_03885 [Burkholderia ubonensis]KVM39870.1 hypothetical protein WJ54_30045 [Burkholderia ubonensis]